MSNSVSWLDRFFLPEVTPPLDNGSVGVLSNVGTVDLAGTEVSAIRFTGSGPITITGLANGRDGRRIHLRAVGGSITLANESATSLATNRIVTGTGNVLIPQGAAAWLVYDKTAGRWSLSVDGGGGGGLIVFPFLSGVATHDSSTWRRVGAAKLDLSLFPDTVGGKVRTARFMAAIEKSAGATAVEARLFDIDHNVSIAVLTNNANALIEVTSPTLSQGSASGNLRTDVATLYEVALRMNGGLAGTDLVGITSARLHITYE